MTYRIKFKRPLAKERRRIALEQIDEALTELERGPLDVGEYIHQLRVKMKKLRALVRLYRFENEKWYRSENNWFRTFAQEFAGPRDADVAVHTCEAILNRCQESKTAFEFQPIMSLLERARDREFESDSSATDLERIRELLSQSRTRVLEWPVKKLKADIVVNSFARTYSRGWKAQQHCEITPHPEAWHEWRKRVKYQRYQWELLQGLWPKMTNLIRHELHRLSDLLGEVHDLTEFVNTLERLDIEDARAKQKLIALARRRTEHVRGSALPLGQKLFAERENCVKARVGAWVAIACNR